MFNNLHGIETSKLPSLQRHLKFKMCAEIPVKTGPVLQPEAAREKWLNPVTKNDAVNSYEWVTPIGQQT